MESLENMAANSLKNAELSSISTREKHKISREITCSVIALMLLATGFIYKSLWPTQGTVAGLFYLAGVLIEGVPIFVRAVRGFLHKDITNAMEILVSIAILASFIDGQHELAILIPVILTVVHFFEEKSIMGGRDAIEGLKKMQSKTALLDTAQGEKSVDVATLKIGDVIIVKPGMSLPIDGKILWGSSNLDQKSLTGESMPKAVHEGDMVYAGTSNIDGVMKVQVEKPYNDTSFSKILDMLEESQKIEIPEMRIVDRFMHYYIPFSLIIAAAVALITNDISKAIAILVVSCPCGQMLVSSAPMIATLATATKRGVLIKNSKFVEDLTKIDMIVFDKTGTITKGDLDITGYALKKGESLDVLLQVGAIAACQSLHPISKALVAHVDPSQIDRSYEIKEYIGKGIVAVKGTDKILFGNGNWAASLGFDVKKNFSNAGSVNWVIRNGAVLGCLMFDDSVREDAELLIENLKSSGIKETVLLTGDNKSAAEKIADTVKIDRVYCNLLPEHKLDYVREFKKEHSVLVVGDGINDALALSEANVGISMGAMGSDAAIQSSDIALMNNDLSNIPFVLSLARRTKGIMYQNIFIAFGISFTMIMLSALGVISALLGAFLHNIGAFVILLNSARLLKK